MDTAGFIIESHHVAELKKRFSSTAHVAYLGHVNQPGILAISTRLADVKCIVQNPKSMTEMKSFLRLCNLLLYRSSHVKLSRSTERWRRTSLPTLDD